MSYLNQLLTFFGFVVILMIALLLEAALPACRPYTGRLFRTWKQLRFAVVSRYLAIRMWITLTLAPRLKSLRASLYFSLRHR